MANYTMFLKDILDLPFEDTTIKVFLQNSLASFPNQSEDMTFYSLFERRNLFKEIGFETVEGWCQIFKGVADRARILYGDKVRLQQENLDTLLSRVIEEEDERTSTFYYNPTNAASQPQVEDMKVNNANRMVTKNQRIAGLFKSNPEVMEEMAKMTVLMDELLTYFDRCFMGVF